LAAQSITNVFSGPHYFQDTLDQMDQIGVGSLPIVLLTGFFIGAVMVLQTASQFVRFGQTSLTGDAVSLALVRELGPTLTSLLVQGDALRGCVGTWSMAGHRASGCHARDGELIRAASW